MKGREGADLEINSRPAFAQTTVINVEEGRWAHEGELIATVLHAHGAVTREKDTAVPVEMVEDMALGMSWEGQGAHLKVRQKGMVDGVLERTERRSLAMPGIVRVEQDRNIPISGQRSRIKIASAENMPMRQQKAHRAQALSNQRLDRG